MAPKEGSNGLGGGCSGEQSRAGLHHRRRRRRTSQRPCSWASCLASSKEPCSDKARGASRREKFEGRRWQQRGAGPGGDQAGRGGCCGAGWRPRQHPTHRIQQLAWRLKHRSQRGRAGAACGCAALTLALLRPVPAEHGRLTIRQAAAHPTSARLLQPPLPPTLPPAGSCPCLKSRKASTTVWGTGLAGRLAARAAWYAKSSP